MVHLDPSWARLPTTSGTNFTKAHYNATWSRFNASSSNNGGSGAAHGRTWLGLTAEEQAHFNSIYKYSVPEGAGIWDPLPATPFLVHVPAEPSGSTSSPATATSTYSNDAEVFFGKGGVANPDGKLVWSSNPSPSSPALIASTPVTVAAKSKVKLNYIWGYAKQLGAKGNPNADVADVAARMVTKYTPILRAKSGLANAVEVGWAPYLARFKFPSPPSHHSSSSSNTDSSNNNSDSNRDSNKPPADTSWVEGETAWHSYYLQAATTYDSYMGEHIVDQGTMYRYSSGFQGAARDPVQHALPLIELRPALVKSVLRYTLSSMYSNFTNNQPTEPGLLPYALYGRAIIADGSFNPLDATRTNALLHQDATENKEVGTAIGGTAIRPDDMELYVLLCASEYILATKDLAFLNETITFFGRHGRQTVLQALQRAVHFVVDVVGVGPHGLMRELTSDWDDGIGAFANLPPHPQRNCARTHTHTHAHTRTHPHTHAHYHHTTTIHHHHHHHHHPYHHV